MFGIFFAGCYNIDNKNKKYMTMAKTGSIGVTTENIFPVIKNSFIAIMKSFCESWYLMR